MLLPPTAACTVDAKTSSGGIEIDAELAPEEIHRRGNHAQEDLNGGGETLKLRTSGGRIEVKAR